MWIVGCWFVGQLWRRAPPLCSSSLHRGAPPRRVWSQRWRSSRGRRCPSHRHRPDPNRSNICCRTPPCYTEPHARDNKVERLNTYTENVQTLANIATHVSSFAFVTSGRNRTEQFLHLRAPKYSRSIGCIETTIHNSLLKARFVEHQSAKRLDLIFFKS